MASGGDTARVVLRETFGGLLARADDMVHRVDAHSGAPVRVTARRPIRPSGGDAMAHEASCGRGGGDALARAAGTPPRRGAPPPILATGHTPAHTAGRGGGGAPLPGRATGWPRDTARPRRQKL